jgi:signal peptidase I
MADPSEPTVAQGTPKRTHWLRETLVVVVVALAAALLLRTFVVQTFYIPSGSMEPTLKVGDRILVDKLSYHLHGVDRGNIVVFRRPADENCGGPPVADLVKGRVLIDGKRLNESYLPSSVQGTTFPGPSGPTYNLAKPYVIPSNHYFVMGDNRADSCDSRYWGPIARSLIVGKVDVRVWPITSFRFF